jgi:hypothetical protein
VCCVVSTSPVREGVGAFVGCRYVRRAESDQAVKQTGRLSGDQMHRVN